MKRQLMIPLMALAMLPVSAQKLTVTNATVNAGRTGYLQPITATFELRNKSKRKLIIESVKPDCGCTAVEYPKEVDANKKFTIKMTYDARMLGHFQKMAAVKSNGSEKPVYLTMKGIVLTEMVDYTGRYPLAMGDLLLDKNDLEYDDVNKGDHPVQEIHIFNNSEETMTPNVMHLPPYLTALVMPEKLEPAKAGTIAITLNSEKLRDFGLNQTSVYIAKKLGEKVSQDNEVPVSAVLLPDLKDYPDIKPPYVPEELRGQWTPYQRNAEGVRYWAVPGREGFAHILGGLEKDNQTGAISTNPENHDLMTRLRQQKVDSIPVPDLEVLGDKDDADLLIVGFGSTYGHLHTAMDELRAQGKKVAMAQFRYIRPLPANTAEVLTKYKKVVVAEQNMGQLAAYLRMHVDGFAPQQFNQVKGQPFIVEELVKAFEGLIKS